MSEEECDDVKEWRRWCAVVSAQLSLTGRLDEKETCLYFIERGEHHE